MIGQKQLIKQIDSLIKTGFPQFVVITGEKGSGKKTIAEDIASKIAKIHWTLEDNKIANIREMIGMSYNNYQPTVCIIPEADTLSSAAQNAILKLVEEPPKNTYFIMTTQDINYVLSTIKSRAFVLTMDPYTSAEISEYAKEDNKLYSQICETPGECDLLQAMNIEEFVDFVTKVVDNIGEVATANALKLGQSIAMKEDDKGYDMKLFFKVFIYECMQRDFQSKGHQCNYLQMELATSKMMQKLRIKGVNKQMLFTDWIMEMRRIWKLQNSRRK